MKITKDEKRILMPESSYLNNNWKDYTMKPHTHGFLEMNYIMEGSCSYLVGERVFPLKKHNLIVFDASILHKKIFDHRTPCSVLGCSFSFCDGYELGIPFGKILEEEKELYRYLQELKDVQVIENAQKICPDMQELCRQFKKKKDSYYTFTLGNKILFTAAELSREPENPAAHYISQTKSLIETCYYKIQSIEEIAAEINLNKIYLERIFKKETGMTLWQYVMECRMDAARNLLSESEIPIGEIDTLIGMNSRQTFYLQFKKRFGISPNEYRNVKNKNFHKEKVVL